MHSASYWMRYPQRAKHCWAGFWETIAEGGLQAIEPATYTPQAAEVSCRTWHIRHSRSLVTESLTAASKIH
jgi:hypothetical protein